MKKRTLVCFLIFILCVFHSTIIPDTVFGQSADPTPEEFAQQVYDDFSGTLERADLQDLVVQVLAALTNPETLKNPLLETVGGFESALNLVLASPSLITQIVADEDGTIQALIKDDADVRAFLMDADARALMQSTEAAKELLRLLFANDTWVSSLSETNLSTLSELLSELPEPTDINFTWSGDGGILTVTWTEPDDPDNIIAEYKVIWEWNPTRSVTVQKGTTSYDIEGIPADATNLKVTVVSIPTAASGINPPDDEMVLASLSPNTELITTRPTQAEPAPPTITIITPSPTTAQKGSFNVAFTTADANADTVTVTGTRSVVPAEAANYYRIPTGTLTSPVTITQTRATAAMPTIPGATVTLTLVANDGTTDSTPATIVVSFDTEEFTPPPEPPPGGELPAVELVRSNLNGKSRLGGLSVRGLHGRQFIRDLIAAAGLGAVTADTLVEPAVEALIALIPIEGILPEDQIRKYLISDVAVPIFADDPAIEPVNEDGFRVLDPENFGNGITPTLSEALYTDVDNTSKFSTRDNLNVYVRVPSTLDRGSVQFRLNGVEKAQGQRIGTDVFQQPHRIPYTFRLEETLAAANLPAWPGLPLRDDGQPHRIFSAVKLIYSQQGLDQQFIDVQMNPVPTDKGVVWEFDVGIIPGRNVYYYFEVTLEESVKLEIVNREALAEALFSPDGKVVVPPGVDPEDYILREYPINSWSMPDPRNLQLTDRGLFKVLFDGDVQGEVVSLLPLLTAGPTNLNIQGPEFRRLRNLLLRNINKITQDFESNFDPGLASVFTAPKIDTTTQSLWYANLDEMDDSEYNLEAVVYNANGEAVDHIAVTFNTDTSAPEATITIGPANADTTGYWNKDDVFVATAPNKGTSSLLNITSRTAPGEVGVDEGFLIYQIIALDADGNPEGTWLPLTIEASLLSSDIWGLVKERFPSSLDDSFKVGVPGADIEIDIRDFALRSILEILTSGLPGIIEAQDIQALVVDGLRGLLGVELTNDQYTLLRDLLGAVVDDIDLFPFTFDPERTYKFAIQGEEDKLPLLIGDYGIRAMGIDPLLNVGSHVAPTQLRIVPYQYDRTSITMAALGDINHNDKDDAYEFTGTYDGVIYDGVIYDNARDVTLTITIDERTIHPLNRGPQHPNASIVVYYMDAAGDWQPIGDIELVEGEGTDGDTRTILWQVGETFEDLLQAGNTVEIRTVTTNALQHPININNVDFANLTADQDKRISAPFTVYLDDDVHPVDPVVLVVDVDPDSIMMTNQDSGAPQGTIMLEGYTPRRTVPATDSIRIEVMRPGDEKPIKIGEVAVDGDPLDGGMTEAIMFKGKTLAEVYAADELHIDATSSYLKWVITVDTTLLDDTITVDSPAARDASLDENRYMVRAYAVDAEGNDISPVLMGEDYTEQFSVDNDDDVAPLGPTKVVVTGVHPDTTDPVFIDNGDGTYTVGGLVDKYDPNVKSPVITLTLTPTADRHTYKDGGVKLLTTLPEGAIISDIVETAEGSGVFTVTIDVGTLMDDDEEVYNDKYLQNHSKDPHDLMYNPTEADVYSFQVHALAYDNAEPYDDVTAADEMFLEYGNIQADDYEDDEITINVENTYRPDPGVLAIVIENSDGMVNPDSGAPQGRLTFDVYTYGITSAPTEGIRVEVKRPVDDTWERITGTADPSEIVNVSEVPVADLSDILTDAANAGIISTSVISALVDISEAEGGSPVSLMKWSYEVDTRKLALEDTFTEDDEPINRLEDTISRGDDSQRAVSSDKNMYVVRAISLTPKNKAHPEYMQRDGVEASFSLDNDDDVPPLGPTNIIDVADVAGFIAPNEEDGSYTVSLIDDDPALSTDVTFTIKIDEIVKPLTYAGGKVRLVRADDPDNKEPKNYGSLNADGIAKVTVDVGDLDNGTYEFHALVIDEFGNEQEQGEGGDMHLSPIYTVHVQNFRLSDISNVMVTAVDGESPDRLPLQETVEGLQGRFPLKESIAVSFNVADTSFLEKDDLTAVLIDAHEVAFEPDGEGSSFSLMASELSKVADGWYTPYGQVTKRNGSVTFALATINLDNTGPMITIETPTEGATVNDLPTLLASFDDNVHPNVVGSGVSDGSGVSEADTAVVLLDRLRPKEVVQDAESIVVDQKMVEEDLDSVVYTRIDKLAGGAYQFTVKVSDKLGNEGEASVNFAVEGIDPTVVITAPYSGQKLDTSPENVTGFFAGGGEVKPTKFTVNGDNVDVSPESEVFKVEGNNFTYTPTEAFDQGDHKVEVEVTDGSGLTAQTSLTFTVDTPGPTVAIYAVEMYDISQPTIKGEFSGDADPVSLSLTLDGDEVLKIEEGEEGENSFEFKPENPLDDGQYTLVAVVTDTNGKTAKATSVFTIRLPVPAVSISSPVEGGTYDHTFRHISGEFTGVGDVTVMLTVDEDDPIELEPDGNEFTHTLPGKLSEGPHTVSVSVKDANDETADATTTFSVVYPEPTITIQSPVAGHIYDNGSIIVNGEFTGVGDNVDDFEVTLTIGTDKVELTKGDGNQFSGKVELPHGPYTATAEVVDANKQSAKTSVDFIVDIPGPSVAILSPAPGQTYYHGKPTIRGHFAGMPTGLTEEDMTETKVEVTTFTINGEDKDVKVEENQFTYTPTDDMATDEYVVMVEVTDENGKTAQATVVFNIKLDTTPPVISEVGPSGIVKDSWVNISAVITDEQSDIISVEFYIRDESDVNKAFIPFVSSVDPGPANHRITADKIKNGQIEISDSFEPGTHTMQVIAESLGGKTVHSWSFTVVIDNIPPIITSITPSGTIHRGLPTISVSANDESGVKEILITVMDDSGEEVTGVVVDEDNPMNDTEPDVTGITRQDFIPENPLDEGSYTIEVRATDTNGNSSTAKGVFSVDFDTAAPIITSSSPQDGARLTYKQTFNKQTGNDDKENARPTISLTYGDTETGVNVGSIKLVIEAPKQGGGTLIAPIDLTDDQKSATQVLYTLSSPVFPDDQPLEPGEYKVKLEVSDNAHQQGNVPEDNDGARKANTAVYHFSFFVEYSDAPILAVKPYNHPNPFKDNTRISFTLNRSSTVSIVIYDVTLRPVRVLKDNEVMPAGNYIGRHGTQWDGKTSSGENLARGIYFCEIVVNDGIEPEYAILKLALTR